MKPQRISISWLEIGGRDPKARLSLTTHSGSVWEIMCETLSLNILERIAPDRAPYDRYLPALGIEALT